MRFLVQEGFGPIKTEVPLWLRRIDIVASDPSGRLLACEAKLRDWRRALRQAEAYQLAAHRAVVAMPVSVAERIPRAEFERRGVGLWAVDGTVSELVEPRRSRRVRPALRRQAVDYVRS
jgi:hypothetical protein